jgi:hypothetical protein
VETEFNKKMCVTRLVSIILSIAVAFQIFNNSVYQHSHILPDGTIVIHAHPYNKTADNSPLKKHNHTISEIQILQNFEILFILLIAGTGISCFFQNRQYFAWQRPVYAGCYCHRVSGRSPPFI